MEKLKAKVNSWMPFLRNLTIVTVLIIVCWGFLFKKPKQIYLTKPVKVIEHEIREVKKEVKVAGERVEVTKKTLLEYKEVFDTVNIVRYQDSVIIYQDTQIVKLTEVVKLQDTAIMVLKHDNKRLKRQRNIAIIVGSIATGVAILK